MKFNTILIQGAMDIEVEYLKEELKINEDDLDTDIQIVIQAASRLL